MSAKPAKTRTPPSQKALADALGTSARQVRRWRADGMPTHDVTLAQEWLERRANPGPLNPAQERARRDRLVADRAQHDLDVRRGKYLLAATVKRETFELARALRDAFLELPGLLAQEEPAAFPPRLVRLLDRHIRAILHRLSGTPMEEPSYPAASAPSAQEWQRASDLVKTLAASRLYPHPELLERAAAVGASAWALSKELFRVGWVPRGDVWYHTDRHRPWLDPLVGDLVRKLDIVEARQRDEEADKGDAA